MLTHENLTTLARTDADECISIYMPTHRAGPETRKGPIRLGNMLREAQQRAEEAGLDKNRTKQRLERISTWLDDENFFQHQEEGLAVFVLGDSLVHHRLPHRVEELVVAGKRPHVRPILPSVHSGETFYVLALSLGEPRLIECTRDKAEEVDVPDLPDSISDALGYDFEEKSLQHWTAPASGAGGRQEAMYHGQGRGGDEDDGEVRKYLQIVDKAVIDWLRRNDRNAPLVLASVDRLAAMYRDVSHYSGIQGNVAGNAEHRDARELRDDALPIVEGALSKPRSERLARLHDSAHTSKVTTDLTEILNGAKNARIDTLFVVPSDTRWGRFDPEAGEVDEHDHRQPGDEELVDRAIGEALATGAAVIAAAPDELPAGARLAALLRF